MTALLGAPLLAAGCVAAFLALVNAWAALVAVALGGVTAALAALLFAASADRPRRVAWGAVATVAALETAVALVGPLPGIGDPDPIATARSALAAPLRSLVPAPESGLAIGIVLGDRGEIPRDLRNAFAASGTAHLLAVSGQNLTLVASAVALLVRGRLGPVASSALTFGAVALYALLVGPQPSVVRAALMASTVSLALATGRRAAALNALGFAAAAMLALDPRTLADVGFLLSAGATAGLILLQRPIAERLGFLPPLLRDGLATTLAATAPTLPIVAAVFGRVSVISPLANLAAVPLLPPLLLFGAATSLVGAVWHQAAWPFALATFASAWTLRRVAELAAALPLASLEVPSGAASGIALAAVLAGAPFLAPRAGALAAAFALARAVPTVRSAALVGAGGIVFAASAATAASLPPPSGFRLHALDVGQGDAFLLESDGRYALIDGGPDPALLLRRLGEALPPWQRRIDLVVLTHEHTDHGAGLLAVLDRYEVALAVEPRGMNDVAFTRMWRERLERRAVPRRALGDGAEVRVGDVVLRVLAPGERSVAVPSLVIRASRGDASALFMGDATDDAIADLLLDPGRLASRAYVPPHHGAESAYSRELLAAVRPEVAFISVGAFNRYGHPVPSTLAALSGLPVYRTDGYGNVDADLDAAPISVRTAKAPLPSRGGGSVPSATASR